MDYWDIEWFALETNRDHSVFETASIDCILDYFIILEKSKYKLSNCNFEFLSQWYMGDE